MGPFRVIAPLDPFPDPAVKPMIQELGYRLVADTVGARDAIEEWRFESGDGSTSVRYLLEPELAIPVFVVSGPEEAQTAEAIRARTRHFDPLAVAVSYTPDANDTVKNTALKVMAAQSLELATPPILRAVALAVLDPSPYIRLAAIQVAQYAHNPEIADAIRPLAAGDSDPDVRAFAQSVLAVFDAAPSPEPAWTPMPIAAPDQ